MIIQLMTSVNPESSCIRMGSGPALFGLARFYCIVKPKILGWISGTVLKTSLLKTKDHSLANALIMVMIKEILNGTSFLLFDKSKLGTFLFWTSIDDFNAIQILEDVFIRSTDSVMITDILDALGNCRNVSSR